VCRSKWESLTVGTGVKWSEIYSHSTNLGKPGFGLSVVKEWRGREANAGRPSSLEDFYRTHGLCFDCRCSGVIVTGFDEETLEYLYGLCLICKGTGRTPES